MGQTSITRPGDQQTDVSANVAKNASAFKPSYLLLTTQRFGEYSPHYVADVVPSDKNFKLQSVHQVRTFSLKSPLLSDFSIKKDYFIVYDQCILPNNWEKVFKNPELGDDVPSDAGTASLNASRIISTQMKSLWDAFLAEVTNGSYDLGALDIFKKFLPLAVYGSYFYSDGCLLANLGCHLSKYFQLQFFDNSASTRDYSIDDIIDLFFAGCYAGGDSNSVLFKCYIDNVEYSVFRGVTPNVKRYDNALSLREFFFKELETGNGVAIDENSFNIQYSTELQNFFEAINSMGDADYQVYCPVLTFPLDFKRVYAYNLVCAHFYTNDQIDYIYTADLYRQLIGDFALFSDVVSDVNKVDTFNYNGVATIYDFLSAHYVDKFLALDNTRSFAALANIFNFNRSLRYLDYFTGAKSRPLAVGDSSVDASQQTVNVIEVVQKTQLARFRNAVHRAGQRIEKYLQEIYHSTPAFDYHNPAYLAHTADQVRNVENENTGTAQMTNENSVTSVLRSNADNFAFETSFDRSGTLIGITYFDIPRCYMDAIERPFFHKDRYDGFIPEMQFVGDQAVYQAELGVYPSLDPFAYDVRYQEYKLRYNQACGGFRNILKGWAFTEGMHRDTATHISPEFIRSRQSDLDMYYIGNIPRYSLASYFHFITANTNFVNAIRPMVKKPQLL